MQKLRPYIHMARKTFSKPICAVRLPWTGGYENSAQYIPFYLSKLEMGNTTPQLSKPHIPILPHAVSILGSLQLQYDTQFMCRILVYLPGTCGTSVLSERWFSKAGEVVAARSNIKPKNVYMILFFKKNLLCFGIVQWLLIFLVVCLGDPEGGSIVWIAPNRLCPVSPTSNQNMGQWVWSLLEDTRGT